MNTSVFMLLIHFATFHEIDWTIASMPKQTDAVYQNEKTKHKILKQEHYCRMVMLSGKN